MIIRQWYMVLSSNFKLLLKKNINGEELLYCTHNSKERLANQKSYTRSTANDKSPYILNSWECFAINVK